MPMNAVYRGPAELPPIIPVFPLPGALLLPRGQMPLNIFEPRYLAMIDDALADRHRLIGMIQPDTAHPGPADRPGLYQIGCVGRITQIAETGDGRYVLELTGVARFKLRRGAEGPDAVSPVPGRLSPVRRRLRGPQGRERGRSRGAAQGARGFPEGQQARRGLGWHREGAERGAGQRARDDVALRAAREAGDAGGPDLKSRAEILVALTEIELAKTANEGETKLQ